MWEGFGGILQYFLQFIFYFVQVYLFYINKFQSNFFRVILNFFFGGKVIKLVKYIIVFVIGVGFRVLIVIYYFYVVLFILDFFLFLVSIYVDFGGFFGGMTQFVIFVIRLDF